MLPVLSPNLPPFASATPEAAVDQTYRANDRSRLVVHYPNSTTKSSVGRYIVHVPDPGKTNVFEIHAHIKIVAASSGIITVKLQHWIGSSLQHLFFETPASIAGEESIQRWTIMGAITNLSGNMSTGCSGVMTGKSGSSIVGDAKDAVLYNLTNYLGNYGYIILGIETDSVADIPVVELCSITTELKDA